MVIKKLRAVFCDIRTRPVVVRRSVSCHAQPLVPIGKRRPSERPVHLGTIWPAIPIPGEQELRAELRSLRQLERLTELAALALAHL